MNRTFQSGTARITVSLGVLLLFAGGVWFAGRMLLGSWGLSPDLGASRETSSSQVPGFSVQPTESLTRTNYLPVVMRDAEPLASTPAVPTSTLTPSLTATPSATPTETPTPAGSEFSPFAMSWLAEVHEAEVRQLATEAGIEWGRIFIDWSSVEPTNDNGDPNTWDGGAVNWNGTDNLINKVISDGMTPLVTLTGNPDWAATTTCGPIDKVSLTELAEFLRAFAERYDGDGVDDAPGSPRIPIISMYNEPDALPEVPPNQGGCWGRAGEAYAQMMAVAWGAIHEVSTAKVAFGAMAYDNFHPDYEPPEMNGVAYPGGNKFNYYFLEGVLGYIQDHPGQEYFDYLNFNYYELYGTYYWEPLMGEPGIIAKTDYLRQKMADYGYSKPLINSEVGEESTCQEKTEETQARYVPQIYAQGMAAGLEVITWWPMRDYAGSCNPGLLRTDNARKPAYRAYQTMTQELVGYSYDHELSGVSGVEGYVFTGSPEKTVVWSTSSTPRQVNFAGSEVRVVYMDTNSPGLPWAEKTVPDGGTDDLDSRSGWVGVQVTENPILVGPPACLIGLQHVVAHANHWGTTDTLYDRNTDGEVNIVDLMMVVSMMGQPCTDSIPSS